MATGVQPDDVLVGISGPTRSSTGRSGFSDQNVLASDDERINENTTIDKQSELNMQIKSALSEHSGTLPPNAQKFFDLLSFTTTTEGALQANSGILPASATSISSFSGTNGTSDNDIDGGTASLTYDNFGGRSPQNGALRAGVTISNMGEAQGYKRIICMGLQFNAVRAGIQSAILQIKRAGSQAEHDLLYVTGADTGDGAFLGYNLGTSYRQSDLALVGRHFTAGSGTSGANRAHFNRGDIMFIFLKLEKNVESLANNAARLVFAMQAVRYDSDGNFLEWQEYNVTPGSDGGRNQLFISQFDFSEIELLGGDANGLSDRPISWFEGFQYTSANPLYNEIHSGFASGQAIDRLRQQPPTDERKLLGMWHGNPVTRVNLRAEFNATKILANGTELTS